MAMIMERPTGVGKVYRGDQEMALVRYTLTIGLASLNDVQGQITVIDGEWNFDADELLTLRLKDHRWFDFTPWDCSGRPPAKTYQIAPAVGGRGLFAPKQGQRGRGNPPHFLEK